MTCTHCIEATKEYPIDYIDQSGAGRYAQCPAKYFFERILGLADNNVSTVAMDYGTDLHTLFPQCYGAKNKQEESILLNFVMDQYIKLAKERNIPEDDKKHTIELTELRLSNFIELHAYKICQYERVLFPNINPPTDTKLVSDVEVPFLIDIGGLLSFAGRIDFPCRMNDTKELFAGDYKTASEISGRLWSCFEISIQAIGYTLALAHLTNENVRGFLVEAIRKSVTKKNCEVQIHRQYVETNDISMFIGYMNSTSKDIVHNNETQKWPKKLSNCSIYSATGIPSGNCPYKILCKSDDWTELKRYYKQNIPFNPLKG